MNGRRAPERLSYDHLGIFADIVVPKAVGAGGGVINGGSYNVGRGSENGGAWSGRYGAAAHSSEVMVLPSSPSHSLVMPSVV